MVIPNVKTLSCKKIMTLGQKSRSQSTSPSISLPDHNFASIDWIAMKHDMVVLGVWGGEGGGGGLIFAN